MCSLTWAVQMMMAFRKFKPMDFALYRLRREKTMFACECVCILHLHLFMVIVYECQYFACPTMFADGNSYMELFIVTSTRTFYFCFASHLFCWLLSALLLTSKKITWSDGFGQKQSFFLAFSNTVLLEMPNLQACKNHTHHPFLVVDTHIYLFLFFSPSLSTLCMANFCTWQKEALLLSALIGLCFINTPTLFSRFLSLSLVLFFNSIRNNQIIAFN